MSAKTRVIMTAAVVAAVLVVVNFRTTDAQIGGMAKMKTPTYVLEGNYRVYYDCSFMDNTKAKDKMELVNLIEFHASYVVLIDQNGAGKLIPVHSIKDVKWERS